MQIQLNMLNNWVKPLSPLTVSNKNTFSTAILRHEKTFPNLENVRIAIIGLDESANEIRKAMYQYAPHEQASSIADIGNIRKNNADFLIPLINELLQIGIVPILISAKEEFISAQFQGYQAFKQNLNVAILDEKIRLDLNSSSNQNYGTYLNSILEDYGKNRLEHLSALAIQGHLTAPDVMSYFEIKNYDIIRLGQLRAALEEAEPILRDADMLAVHISALKQIEAPAQLNPSPSGLFIEETCRLVRYAAISDKLTSIGFYGFLTENDNNNQTAQAIAQMIWYACDGILNRKGDFPKSTDGLVEYIVNYKKHQLSFWRSTKSGRWWLQIPVNQKQKNTLIPCTYNDYEKVCNEELPERLSRAFQRFV